MNSKRNAAALSGVFKRFKWKKCERLVIDRCGGGCQSCFTENLTEHLTCTEMRILTFNKRSRLNIVLEEVCNLLLHFVTIERLSNMFYPSLLLKVRKPISAKPKIELQRFVTTIVNKLGQTTEVGSLELWVSKEILFQLAFLRFSLDDYINMHPHLTFFKLF